MDVLQRIQAWYLSNCNGEWEHGFGMTIGTLDNPGWTIEIDLIGTRNQHQQFTKIKNEKTEDDWIHCWVKDNTFHAACGPLNLEEALKIFLGWVEENK